MIVHFYKIHFRTLRFRKIQNSENSQQRSHFIANCQQQQKIIIIYHFFCCCRQRSIKSLKIETIVLSDIKSNNLSVKKQTNSAPLRRLNPKQRPTTPPKTPTSSFKIIMLMRFYFAVLGQIPLLMYQYLSKKCQYINYVSK